MCALGCQRSERHSHTSQAGRGILKESKQGRWTSEGIELRVTFFSVLCCKR